MSPPGRPDAARLARLLRPRHIAVVGGRYAEEVIRQCRRTGFAGALWPVNPGRREMGGLACFASIEALPEAPDATFIGVSREATLGVVRQLAACDSGGAVALASGFAELDDEGRALQAELIAAAGGLPLVGPNCYGLLNCLDGAALWPDQHGGRRVERGVAIVTQSGNIGINLSMQQRSLPLAYLVSVGNQASLAIGDYVEALADDPRVSAIGIHLEGVPDVGAFARAARAALAAGKPLVALKSGRSRQGARTALSHTSSLAGSDELYGALFERFGVARVASLPALLETLKLLHVHGAFACRRIASMSCSGGEAGLLADLAQDRGLELPAFGEAQASALREVLGARVTVDNPLDYHTYVWGNEADLGRVYGATLASGVDAALLILDYPVAEGCNDADWLLAERALIGAAERTGARALVVATLPECLPAAARERLLARGIAPLQGLDESLQALVAAHAIHAARTAALPDLPLAPAASLADTGTGMTLDEHAAKQVLRQAGIAVPEARVVDAGAAAAAAAGIGYPVVLKALAPGLAHKSEHGAVRLGLGDAATLGEAIDAMAHLGGRFLVERMIDDAVAEVLVGVTRDHQFGPSLVLGAGGTLVELLAETVPLLLPTSPAAIESALRRLRLWRILEGHRGAPPGDVAALVDAVVKVADYAGRHAATLLELDINPLLVRPRGRGVVAVDALLRLAG